MAADTTCIPCGSPSIVAGNVNAPPPLRTTRTSSIPALRICSRSEERRVGKECVSTCRSRWSPYDSKKRYDHISDYKEKRSTVHYNNDRTLEEILEIR